MQYIRTGIDTKINLFIPKYQTFIGLGHRQRINDVKAAVICLQSYFILEEKRVGVVFYKTNLKSLLKIRSKFKFNMEKKIVFMLGTVYLAYMFLVHVCYLKEKLF